MNKKKCSRCKDIKKLDDFPIRKNRRSGYQSWCKKCVRELSKENYNPDNKRSYYKNNKKSILNNQKNYYLNNKSDIKNKNKKYYNNWINSPFKFNSKSKYRKEIELYEEIIESDNGNLMCKCAYCGEWFEPTKLKIQNRIDVINGKRSGECRLYCSDQCKQNCPIFNQVLYSRDQKPATSREVQPELRQMVFERDKYTCQKCDTHRDNLEVGIHCHHKEGTLWEPLQSADMDICITLCEDCHKEVHGIDGCGYYEMRCAVKDEYNITIQNNW